MRRLSAPFPPFPPVQNQNIATRCDDFQGVSGTFRDIFPGLPPKLRIIHPLRPGFPSLKLGLHFAVFVPFAVNKSQPPFPLGRAVESGYVMRMADKPKRKRTAVMLGVGLDSDGHKRVTTGPNFALVGGTRETHDSMTEKALKINEKLAAKGKQLHEISPAEFEDIAHSVGLKRTSEKESGEKQD
jgi:hypothetical protein